MAGWDDEAALLRHIIEKLSNMETHVLSPARPSRYQRTNMNTSHTKPSQGHRSEEAEEMKTNHTKPMMD